jgi:hypothetical protein
MRARSSSAVALTILATPLAFSSSEARPHEQPLWATRNYDVAPDGQRFVFARAVSSGRSQLVVVQNFFEVLRRAAAD